MLKKDIKAIDQAIKEEQESGHTFCDFDDEQHDLRAIAEIIGVDMIENDEEEFVCKRPEDTQRVKDALTYYYEKYYHYY